MGFDIFCLLTGHKPYVIGMCQEMTLLGTKGDPNSDDFRLIAGPYDDRKEVCLACGKTLRVIGKDA